MSISTVVIQKSGKMLCAEVDTKYDLDTLVEKLETMVVNKGYGKMKLIGAYPMENLLLFGWTSGKHGQINRHEFAPPYDTDLFYGDIVLVKMKNTNTVSFSSMDIDEYNQIYESLFGGFESLGSSDTEEEKKDTGNDPEYDPDYHPDDDERKEYESDECTEYDSERSDTEEAEWNFNEDDTESDSI